ncbi:MAG: hypothetical protein LBK41_02825, partial [Clostridiales bacterium]|nr:hypothetical protein [Clostridiales bacterium]
VRAVYEFLMFQFAHNGERLRSNGRAIEMPDTSLGTLRLGAPALRAYNLFRYGHGDCSIFSAAFAVMLTRIGIDCEIYEGYYINSNGSKVHHYWNRANVGGDWYWYDVDVDGTIWRRDGKLMFMLYKKGASEWKKTHKSGWWQVYSAGDVRGAVPAGFAAVALPAPAPDLNAGAPDSPEPTVIYNGERIEFEAPPILDGGYAIVPARELFEGMGATVDWTPGADGTGMTVIERGGVRLRIVPSLGICVKETADGVSDIAAEASATVYAGRVYVPARSLAEAFGAEVAWDGGTLTVTIFE